MVRTGATEQFRHLAILLVLGAGPSVLAALIFLALKEYLQKEDEDV